MSPVREFLLVGGITLFLFPLAWLVRTLVGLDSADYAFGALTFYGAYVINDPHFTVTYFLFYKDARKRALGEDFGAKRRSPRSTSAENTEIARVQRIRWWIAGVVVPIVLATWAIVALRLRSAQALGWMVQLMFLLVGWHYVKQGFGVLTVLSARRGAVLTKLERTVILSHCFAGWGFAWANPSKPAGEYEEKGVVYWAPAHPRWLELVTGAVLAASTIALVVVLVQKWRRERRMIPIAPFAGLLITVWSWTIFSAIDPLVQYVIPALHAVQYFYFVWLMKRNEARASEGPPLFGRPVKVQLGILAISALGLGWLLFRGMPTFLDDAFVPRSSELTPLGATPFFAAFFVFVNIHHYFMDGVIWRRENPDTRWLRDQTST